MSTNLTKSRYVSELASSLYSWLPGSNPPYSRSYTFNDVAAKYSLRWIGGSKLPALQNLLETAENRSTLTKLVLNVIEEGLKYRARKNDPVKREEIETINSIMLKLGYRIPELTDEKFLSSLSKHDLSDVSVDRIKLADLDSEYRAMKKNPDVQSRGYEVQSFLWRMFTLWRLNPREPLRISGEEIDGSIELDNETYLLEARWRKNPSNKDDLTLFSSKIGMKSKWSRGIFISVSGFKEQALSAFTTRGGNSFIAMKGDEIDLVLAGKIDLAELLRKKVRISAEEGTLYFQDEI